MNPQHSPSKPRKPITISEDDSVVGPPMRRCISMPDGIWDIPSIMKFRTLDESLHSKFGSTTSDSMDKRTSFDSVVIREYGRTIGDNPACSSGPPLCISWDYNVLGKVKLNEFERNRPPRRTNFEMVIPRKEREEMLKSEWNMTQRQVADAVRKNVRCRMQRVATVNNLDKATRMEEIWESAGRKFMRIVRFQRPVSAQVRALEAKMNEAQRIRKQRKLQAVLAMESQREESARIPESVSTYPSSSHS
eukprot:Nitzschia sp. Nitz4//scaffold116_size91068//5492//6342//NITZ4_004945-RA/size91068-augustus-gene-0.50-mRNA-1//1//CDS//3329533539//5726//frame0